MVESVLIPKDEYDSLLEKVSKSLKGNDIEFQETKENSGLNDDGDVQKKHDAMDQEQEAEEVDNGVKNFTKLSYIDGKEEEGVTNEETGDLMHEKENEKPDKRVSPTKTPVSDYVEVNKNMNSTEGDNDDDVDKVDEGINSINLLLVKVPQSLKQGVKILADYIAQNGRGIIEWDKSLRLRYFEQVIPKTNFVKLICHALKETLKTPKAYTLFKKALKSIGITSPNEWVLSQTENYTGKHEMEEEEGEQATKVNNNNNPLNENIKGRKNYNNVKGSTDMLDGSGNLNIKNPQRNSKEARLKKLKLNWVTY